MYRALPLLAAASLIGLGHAASAAPVTLLNPGGELGPSANITPGSPANGWDATALDPGIYAAALQNVGAANVNSGTYRLNVGIRNDDPLNPLPIADTDMSIFQVTSAVIAEGDTLKLDYFARPLFQMDAADGVVSVFGYINGGVFTAVDSKSTTNLTTGVYTALDHTHVVGAGSTLIGQQLAIGFQVDIPANADGAFVGIDDVSLDVTPIPEPGSLALLALGGMAMATRRRR